MKKWVGVYVREGGGGENSHACMRTQLGRGGSRGGERERERETEREREREREYIFVMNNIQL